MKSKLALEKAAESMLSISDNLAVAGVLAPFTYLLDISSLDDGDQLILRVAPFVIVIAAIVLRVTAMKAFDKLSTMQ